MGDRVRFRSVAGGLLACGIFLVEGKFHEPLEVTDDFGGIGFDGAAAGNGGGGLEPVEDQGGSPLVDLATEQETNDVGDGDLNGSVVLEDGDIYVNVIRNNACPVFGAGTQLHVVKVTEALILDGRGTASDSVDLNLLAAANGCRIRTVGITHIIK